MSDWKLGAVFTHGELDFLQQNGTPYHIAFDIVTNDFYVKGNKLGWDKVAREYNILNDGTREYFDVGFGVVQFGENVRGNVGEVTADGNSVRIGTNYRSRLSYGLSQSEYGANLSSVSVGGYQGSLMDRSFEIHHTDGVDNTFTGFRLINDAGNNTRKVVSMSVDGVSITDEISNSEISVTKERIYLADGDSNSEISVTNNLIQLTEVGDVVVKIEKTGIMLGASGFVNNGGSDQWSIGQLHASKTPTSTSVNRYAVLGDVLSNTAPIGSVIMWAGTTTPEGWLICNGNGYDSINEEYALLFAVIGHTFTLYPNPDYFNVPDLEGKAPVGVGKGYDDNGADKTFTLGEKTGEYVHKLSIDEIPNHTHDSSVPNEISLNSGGQPSRASSALGLSGEVTGHGVNDLSHNNIQPVLGIYFIIRYK